MRFRAGAVAVSAGLVDWSAVRFAAFDALVLLLFLLMVVSKNALMVGCHHQAARTTRRDALGRVSALVVEVRERDSERGQVLCVRLARN